MEHYISMCQKPTGCWGLQFELNDGEPVGVSIPATEHSVMTAWPSEREAILNMISHFGSGIFACVMDSYDYAKVASHMQIPADCAALHCMSPLLVSESASCNWDPRVLSCCFQVCSVQWERCIGCRHWQRWCQALHRKR